MPLTRGQVAALKVIAAARDPESYVAGSIPLNRDHRRYSGTPPVRRSQRIAKPCAASEAASASAACATRSSRS